MKFKRYCLGTLIFWTLNIWVSVAVLALGGGPLIRDLALRGVGFQKQADLESYWAQQPTPVLRYEWSLANPAPVAQPSAPQPQERIVIQVGTNQEIARRQAVSTATPQAVAAAPDEALALSANPSASQFYSIDERWNEFMTITRAANGDPLVIYHAYEADFTRLCELISLCQSDVYRYRHTDLRPDGAVFYGDANLGGVWQPVGIILTVEKQRLLDIGGFVIGGEVYRLPSDHPLRAKMNQALYQLNQEIAALFVYLDGQALQLDAIQLDNERLLVVFR
jgi:hypothetical protein